MKFQGIVAFKRIMGAFAVLACIGPVAGCSSEDDGRTFEEEETSSTTDKDEPCDERLEYCDERLEYCESREEDQSEIISETIEVTNFYEQTVRWGTTNIAFDSAEVLTDTHIFDGEVEFVDRELHLLGTVENRLEKTTSFGPQWVLILEDGTRIGGSQNESVRLEPEASGSFQVDFELPDEASLQGALVEPSSSTFAGEQLYLRVPLDREFESPYPFTIDELDGLEMRTLNPASVTQWEMKILSAQVTLNTDYNLWRPHYGKKFVELVIQAVLLDDAVNDNFWDKDFELRVDGFSVFGRMDGELLYINQGFTDGLVFEIDDEVTDFDFLFDLGHPGVEDETQWVSVHLPPIAE